MCHASSLSSTAPTVCRSNRRARRWPDLTPLPHAGRRAVPRIVKARAAGRTHRGCAYACRGPHTPRPATAARGSQYEGRHPEATSSPGSIDWAHRAWATVISSRRLARSRSSMPACASTGRSCFGVTHRLALSCLDGDHGSGRNQPGGVREKLRFGASQPPQKLSPNLCWLGKMRRLGQALHKHARWRSTNSQCVGLGFDSPRRLCPAVRFTPYLSTSTPASTHQRMALIS